MGPSAWRPGAVALPRRVASASGVELTRARSWPGGMLSVVGHRVERPGRAFGGGVRAWREARLLREWAGSLQGLRRRSGERKANARVEVQQLYALYNIPHINQVYHEKMMENYRSQE